MITLENNRRYKATLHNILPPPLDGEDVEVVSTCNHSASHYGQQVWVDRDGNCYGQITLPLSLGWDIIKLDEISEAEAGRKGLDTRWGGRTERATACIRVYPQDADEIHNRVRLLGTGAVAADVIAALVRAEKKNTPY